MGALQGQRRALRKLRILLDGVNEISQSKLPITYRLVAHSVFYDPAFKAIVLRSGLRQLDTYRVLDNPADFLQVLPPTFP
jgi:hypothetical protein